MNLNFYVTEDSKPHPLTSELGISYLNIAVNDAPYRTGNLRSVIKLQQNGPKTKRIIYNDNDAYYLNFLEEGRGRNKKHVGFIENDTVNDILRETYLFLLSGNVSYSGLPQIVFRTDKPRNYERQILAQNQVSLNKRLTASDRALLSRKYVRDKGLGVGKTYYNRNSVGSLGVQSSNINTKIHYGYAGVIKPN